MALWEYMDKANARRRGDAGHPLQACLDASQEEARNSKGYTSCAVVILELGTSLIPAHETKHIRSFLFRVANEEGRCFDHPREFNRPWLFSLDLVRHDWKETPQDLPPSEPY